MRRMVEPVCRCHPPLARATARDQQQPQPPRPIRHGRRRGGPARGVLPVHDRLHNYLRSDVRAGAGTDSEDGFNLAACSAASVIPTHTLPGELQAADIAGTKEKGSIAAFLTNIMREQGYNVWVAILEALF
ncbi:hypothetical protein ACP70R_023971 [Stipagrostis hirtigluma subsp. patula]